MSGHNAHAIDRLISEVFRLYGSIVAAGDVVAKPFGLSSARWQVMGAIEATGGGTVSDLARQLGLTRQSVQRVVTEMVTEGYCELVENPRHRRAMKVSLTKDGWKSYDAVTAAWMVTAKRMDRAFGIRDIGQLTSKLAMIREDFDPQQITVRDNTHPDKER